MQHYARRDNLLNLMVTCVKLVVLRNGIPVLHGDLFSGIYCAKVELVGRSSAMVAL